MGSNAGGSADHEVCLYRTKLKPRSRKHMRHDVVLDCVPGAGHKDPVTKSNQIGEENQLRIVDLDGVCHRNSQGGSGVAQQLDRLHLSLCREPLELTHVLHLQIQLRSPS
jgi:hypothetical protein